MFALAVAESLLMPFNWLNPVTGATLQLQVTSSCSGSSCGSNSTHDRFWPNYVHCIVESKAEAIICGSCSYHVAARNPIQTMLRVQP